jgi:hypothetical protein
VSEIELRSEAHHLTAQMNFARALASGTMLPDAYRNQPANVLIAIGLGQSMGLSPAESLYRIAVIKGKPTASAELIAANVRKSGHKLRVLTDEQAMSVTATIVRADDPDFEFKVTRDLAWAQSMGLDRNDNYRKQPLTMLQWRAITAVARLACPEALYGVSYTPDEMYDMGGGPQQVDSERVDTPDPSPAPAAGQPEGARDEAGTETSGQPDAMDRDDRPGEALLLNTSSKLAKAMYASINEAGIPKDEVPDLYAAVTGREVASSKELTEDEARAVLRALDEREKDTPLIDVTDAEIVEEQPA